MAHHYQVLTGVIGGVRWSPCPRRRYCLGGRGGGVEGKPTGEEEEEEGGRAGGGDKVERRLRFGSGGGSIPFKVSVTFPKY